MRFLELTLDRYGAFSGRRMVFRPDTRLHVVLGRNEAGKSTALSAIGDLLFGIPNDTSHHFLFPKNTLQISAIIENHAGETLRFVRRKNKPQLTDSAGAVLGDAALQPFLGVLSRDVFRRAFGLNADRLREARKELEETNGDLATALFSAASGLKGLGVIRAQLDEEAGKLFTSSGKEREFNKANVRLRTAEKAIRDRELRAADLQKIQAAIKAAETGLGGIGQRRRALDEERGRVDLLVRTAPQVAEIDILQAELVALSALPEVSTGAGARLASAIAASDAAVAAGRTADALVAQRTAERSAIAEQPALLEREATIARLQQDAGGVRAARGEVPGLAADIQRLERDRADLAARLGLASGAEVETARPDDAMLADLKAAIVAGQAAAERCASARDALGRLEADLARQAVDPQRQQAGDDPRPARELLTAMRPILDRALAAGEDLRRHDAALRRLDEEAARLDPSVADLARLASAPLPGRDAVETTEFRLNQAETLRRDAGRGLAAEADALARAESKRREAARDGTVPSPADLAARRAEREALWRRLRDHVLDPATVPGLERLDLLAAHERAVLGADHAADAMIDAADRVEALRSAEAEVTAVAARHAAAAGTLAAAEAALVAAEADWRRIWDPSGVRPAGPAAMKAWRAGLDALLRQRADLLLARDGLMAARAEGEALRPPLFDLAAGLGLPAMPLLPLAVLMERVEQEIIRREEAWRAAAKLRGSLETLAHQIATARDALSGAEADHARWQTGFADTLARLWLPGDASLVAAAARLEAWREAPGLLRALAERRDRLNDLTAGIERFVAAVAALVAEIAPELATRPPEQAVIDLAERLKSARDARIEAQGADRRLADAMSDRLRCGREADRALTELAEAARAAGLTVDPTTPDATALAERAAGLEARDRTTARLGAARQALAGHLPPGVDEATLRVWLADFDPASAEDRLDTIATERERLDGEADRLRQERQSAQDQLADRAGDGHAEAALQERLMAEADLARIGADWLRTNLASLLIGTAIERHRAAHQGPLLTRAGALFHGLTGGAFADLVVGETDAGRPEIRGRRAGDVDPALRDVAVEGLSEGTRDQLFLALKLAYLEDFAGRSEPAPFIGDDLFTSFDDERAAHGLQALAEIGARVQPILFTHHGHLAEIATATLGSAADIIRLDD